MKVKELLAALIDLDPEMEVILEKDSGAGLSYSPLKGVDYESVYIPENTWSGEAYSVHWSADEADCTEEEWAEIKARQRCAILFPVH